MTAKQDNAPGKVEQGGQRPASKARSHGRPRTFDRDKALETALRIFWQLGYEPASVASICSAIGINPPSFYSAFGSKEELFMEAVRYYEKTYWTGVLKSFESSKRPISQAVADFFKEAARILLNPKNPSGCMVVLAAVNISPKEKNIAAQVKDLRMDTRNFFARRLERARAEGELAAEADIAALADSLNIFLEGMSIQAKDGLPLAHLLKAADLVPLILAPYVLEDSSKRAQPLA